MIRLTVKDGSIQQTVTLDADKVFIGRMPSNTLRIEDDSVSRKHCLIRRTGRNGLEVLDLNSRHGTRKNGESVERASLAIGDRLELGDVLIRIEGLEGAPEELGAAPPPTKSSWERAVARARGGDGEETGTATAVTTRSGTSMPGTSEAGTSMPGTSAADSTSPVASSTATNAAPAGATEGAAATADGLPARATKVLLSDAYRHSFSEELYRVVRRTPWWAISLFLHAFLVYVFFYIPFLPPETGSPFGRLEGRLDDDFAGLLQEDALSPEDQLPDFEDELEKLPDPIQSEDVPFTDDEPEPIDEETPEPPVISPLAPDFAVRIGPQQIGRAISVPDVDFDQTGKEGANEQASKLLRAAMGGTGQGLAMLRRLSRHDVLVVDGHYDHVEKILDLLRVRYVLTTVRKLERMKVKELDRAKILFINCSNEGIAPPTLKRIRGWVERGGYLLTTDWGIENVLEPGFPGYLRAVKRHGRNAITPNVVVNIHASARAKNHFLLTGTHLGHGESKWWLEESSYPFKVLKPDLVEVVVESTELRETYGAEAVAVTFRVGEGRVFHMLGHFFQEEGNLKGAFSTQRLIANFVLSALRKR